MQDIVQNPFLLELLRLQQDGNQAISAPANWTRTKPLLEVDTELDNIVRSLTTKCLGKEKKECGRWHFFIGSPGNGKSAAVGKMVRKLIEEHDCNVADDNNNDIDELSNDIVPYSLNVFESGKRFSFLRIVQDASVVKKPYEVDVDPAKDLADTIEDAWNRGISLVVCTNRGVLEKAYRDIHTNTTHNQKTWYKAILKPLVERPGEFQAENIDINSPERTVFSKLDVCATFLDSRSLMLGGCDIFDRIIQKAVADESWSSCKECSHSDLCPFKANRDWLADATGREAVCKIFLRAEVFSSQVLVFREALAAISFILAGCARDYSVLSPCEWVHELIDKGDLFALLSRRIYACIFSSFTNRGLDKAISVKKNQVKALRDILKYIPDVTSPAAKAVTCLLDGYHPSTDVGVTRLFGEEGVFSQLDPLKGPLSPKFFDAWDGNYIKFTDICFPYISKLEVCCANIWNKLEEDIEKLASCNAANSYWVIRRWSSEFTLHLGSLWDSLIISSVEIDEFTELLSLLSEKKTLNIDEKRRCRKLENLVSELLNKEDIAAQNDGAVHLAENITVIGNWVQSNMRPKIKANPASGSLSIAIQFGNATDNTTLAASMYIWLKQRARGTIDHRCIPDDLLSEAMDAKARATAKSSYAFVPDDVTLRIEGENKIIYELLRFHGEVDASDQPNS